MTCCGRCAADVEGERNRARVEAAEAEIERLRGWLRAVFVAPDFDSARYQARTALSAAKVPAPGGLGF